MDDIVLHIAVGYKNDRLTADAGPEVCTDIIQDRVEGVVMALPWVTDMLVSLPDVEDDLIVAVRAIVDAAIEHGVNDEVAGAIAHAELVAGMRGR